jgi:hypothetical protein
MRRRTLVPFIAVLALAAAALIAAAPPALKERVIQGRVLGADGAPLPGLMLVVRDPAAGVQHGVVTNAIGRYRVRTPLAGPFDLYVFDAGDTLARRSGVQAKTAIQSVALRADRSRTVARPASAWRINLLLAEARPASAALSRWASGSWLAAHVEGVPEACEGRSTGGLRCHPDGDGAAASAPSGRTESGSISTMTSLRRMNQGMNGAS